jgi:nucleotide-binding universal stress UspA family protein
MKRILVPCDFSAVARHAYGFAVEMAAACDGRVFVLSVMQVPTIFGNGMPGQPNLPSDPISMTGEWIAYCEKEFQLMKQQLGKLADDRVMLLMETGYVNNVVRQVINKEKIDLVIMGTEGASGLKEFLIGSHTEKIVRTSPVPVIAIQSACHFAHVKHIVFPTSLELDQQELVGKVCELQKLFGARLDVLYVNGYPFTLESDQEAHHKLQDYAQFYGLENYTLHVSKSINTQDAILKYARRIPDSMIAMGTHGHTGLKHLVMGSVAEDVVNHLTEPVWTYMMH